MLQLHTHTNADTACSSVQCNKYTHRESDSGLFQGLWRNPIKHAICSVSLGRGDKMFVLCATDRWAFQHSRRSAETWKRIATVVSQQWPHDDTVKCDAWLWMLCIYWHAPIRVCGFATWFFFVWYFPSLHSIKYQKLDMLCMQNAANSFGVLVVMICLR